MNDVILQSFSLEDSQTPHVILYKHTAITVCGHRLTLENHVFLNKNLTTNSIYSFRVL